MKYKVKLNGKIYEVEVEKGNAIIIPYLVSVI